MKMNKACKEYISEIKALFPIKRKQEKTYLKKLTYDVQDYCEETHAITKEDLYSNYGSPEDVVSNYISSLDRTTLIKHINLAQYIKIVIAGLLVAITLATLLWGIYVYRLHEIAVNQETVINEHTIQYYN